MGGAGRRRPDNLSSRVNEKKRQIIIEGAQDDFMMHMRCRTTGGNE